MPIVFTICSANYLARAKVLGDSLRQHAPDVRFIVVLVDRAAGRIRLEDWSPLEIIEIESMELSGFADLAGRCRVVELNTAVKPLVFKFMMSCHRGETEFLYLDPDTRVYSSPGPIFDALGGASALLTPHSIVATPSLHPQIDDLILLYGVYNLGFLAVRRCGETARMLDWWGERLKDRCVNDVENGRFYDQRWMNVAPVYFGKIRLLRHPGCNVGFWNLHERDLKMVGGEWCTNGERLIFYHFSHYRVENPERLCPWDEVSFATYPEMRNLYADYRRALVEANHERVANLKCWFLEARQASDRRRRTSLVRRILYARAR